MIGKTKVVPVFEGCLVIEKSGCDIEGFKERESSFKTRGSVDRKTTYNV
jgi:hypothetical protein